MKDDLDHLLDAALATYTAAEPRAGLDQRVLRRMETADHAPPRGWLKWVIAIPALAAMLVTIWLVQPRMQPAPPPSIAAQIPVVKPEPRLVPVIAPHRKRPAATLPKLEVFPSPSPLSEQERLFLAYVNRAGTLSLASAATRNAEEIKIPELAIKPLARTDEAEGQ